MVNPINLKQKIYKHNHTKKSMIEYLKKQWNFEFKRLNEISSKNHIKYFNCQISRTQKYLIKLQTEF